MKQLVQDVRSGVLRIADVPAPLLRRGGVLVRTHYSVISVGTERTKIEFGKKGLIGKALQRPDQVRKVLDAVAREGVGTALRKVQSRLKELSPLGYSCAGIVEAVGEGVTDVRVGDRVACAGAGYASHAERVWVPNNLVVQVPDSVSLESAAFTTLGAIALQGVRQADVRLGETVAVIGLGILGQLTVQLLQASGVKAVGIDVNATRVALARSFGADAVLRADDVLGTIAMASGGAGADAVIITAATSSEDPIRLAGQIARDRARVVVVGAVPIRVPRSPYFEKELDVRLSRSYGPGRFDPGYEEKGNDYPIGYVRWTERRNLGEFVRLLASGAIRLEPLITHRYPFGDAEQAYEALTKASSSPLGVVLEYPRQSAAEPARITLRGREPAASRSGRVRVGLIGAGKFATGTLMPLLKKLDVELQGVVTASGISALGAAEQLGFRYLAGSPGELLADPDIDAVIIATRHNEHAALTAAALRAGKAVFVEKPLALTEHELDTVLDAANDGPPLLVGFNRRFAPATEFVRTRISRRAGARVVHVRVNAGFIPADNWVHDAEVGGGRLIGEGCHFIDLALHLAGADAAEISAVAMEGSDPGALLQDNVLVTMRCVDGSLASVLYSSRGNPRSGKERIEVFAGGTSAVIDDFRSAEFWSGGRERWKGAQDKGHAAEMAAFIAQVRGGPAAIPLAQIAHSSRATLLAAASLASGIPQRMT